MALFINGTEINQTTGSVAFGSNTDLDEVYYNNTLVWKKQRQFTISYSGDSLSRTKFLGSNYTELGPTGSASPKAYLGIGDTSNNAVTASTTIPASTWEYQWLTLPVYKLEQVFTVKFSGDSDWNEGCIFQYTKTDYPPVYHWSQGWDNSYNRQYVFPDNWTGATKSTNLSDNDYVWFLVAGAKESEVNALKVQTNDEMKSLWSSTKNSWICIADDDDSSNIGKTWAQIGSSYGWLNEDNGVFTRESEIASITNGASVSVRLKYGNFYHDFTGNLGIVDSFTMYPVV